MAYRVEREFAYKIRLDKTGRITTFSGYNDGQGISISFGTPTHSEYYADEHKSEKGIRIVSFEMNDDSWSAIKYVKKFGKEGERKRGRAWLEHRGLLNAKEPTGSDGANLDSFTKKTALTFGAEWLEHLLRSVVGRATVEYPNGDTEMFPAKLPDGTFAGFYTMSDIKTNGFELDEDGWGRDDDDIGT